MVIEESQDLQTHLNLATDFTGNLPRMFSTMSYGRWLFLRRRISGSLIWDIFFSTRERERERVKDTKQGILKLEYQSKMETSFILEFRSTF